jgi:hypothetical protein
MYDWMSDWLSILSGNRGERADKSALAAINRALRFRRKNKDPSDYYL